MVPAGVTPASFGTLGRIRFETATQREVVPAGSIQGGSISGRTEHSQGSPQLCPLTQRALDGYDTESHGLRRQNPSSTIDID